MAKSRHSITYHYEYEHEGTTHDVAITRRHSGTAYARNGNVGNPTEYFYWEARIDGGRAIGTMYRDRSDAYEHARAHIEGIPYANDEYRKRWINVRSWTLVRDEMQANYKRREVAKA